MAQFNPAVSVDVLESVPLHTPSSTIRSHKATNAVHEREEIIKAMFARISANGKMMKNRVLHQVGVSLLEQEQLAILALSGEQPETDMSASLTKMESASMLVEAASAEETKLLENALKQSNAVDMILEQVNSTFQFMTEEIVMRVKGHFADESTRMADQHTLLKAVEQQRIKLNAAYEEDTRSKKRIQELEERLVAVEGQVARRDMHHREQLNAFLKELIVLKEHLYRSYRDKEWVGKDVDMLACVLDDDTGDDSSIDELFRYRRVVRGIESHTKILKEQVSRLEDQLGQKAVQIVQFMERNEILEAERKQVTRHVDSLNEHIDSLEHGNKELRGRLTTVANQMQHLLEKDLPGVSTVERAKSKAALASVLKAPIDLPDRPKVTFVSSPEKEFKIGSVTPGGSKFSAPPTIQQPSPSVPGLQVGSSSATDRPTTPSVGAAASSAAKNGGGSKDSSRNGADKATKPRRGSFREPATTTTGGGGGDAGSKAAASGGQALTSPTSPFMSSPLASVGATGGGDSTPDNAEVVYAVNGPPVKMWAASGGERHIVVADDEQAELVKGFLTGTDTAGSPSGNRSRAGSAAATPKNRRISIARGVLQPGEPPSVPAINSTNAHFKAEEFPDIPVSVAVRFNNWNFPAFISMVQNTEAEREHMRRQYDQVVKELQVAQKQCEKVPELEGEVSSCHDAINAMGTEAEEAVKKHADGMNALVAELKQAHNAMQTLTQRTAIATQMYYHTQDKFDKLRTRAGLREFQQKAYEAHKKKSEIKIKNAEEKYNKLKKELKEDCHKNLQERDHYRNMLATALEDAAGRGVVITQIQGELDERTRSFEAMMNDFNALRAEHNRVLLEQAEKDAVDLPEDDDEEAVPVSQPKAAETVSRTSAPRVDSPPVDGASADVSQQQQQQQQSAAGSTVRSTGRELVESAGSCRQRHDGGGEFGAAGEHYHDPGYRDSITTDDLKLLAVTKALLRPPTEDELQSAMDLPEAPPTDEQHKSQKQLLTAVTTVGGVLQQFYGFLHRQVATAHELDISLESQLKSLKPLEEHNPMIQRRGSLGQLHHSLMMQRELKYQGQEVERRQRLLCAWNKVRLYQAVEIEAQHMLSAIRQSIDEVISDDGAKATELVELAPDGIVALQVVAKKVEQMVHAVEDGPGDQESSARAPTTNLRRGSKTTERELRGRKPIGRWGSSTTAPVVKVPSDGQSHMITPALHLPRLVNNEETNLAADAGSPSKVMDPAALDTVDVNFRDRHSVNSHYAAMAERLNQSQQQQPAGGGTSGGTAPWKAFKDGQATKEKQATPGKKPASRAASRGSMRKKM